MGFIQGFLFLFEYKKMLNKLFKKGTSALLLILVTELLGLMITLQLFSP